MLTAGLGRPFVFLMKEEEGEGIGGFVGICELALRG